MVDDDPSSRQFCLEVLELLGVEVEGVETANEALARLEDGQIDIVVSDVRMPGGNGIELLKSIKANHPGVDVLVMTGFGTIAEAVEAVKLGAYDYITKPFKLDDFRRLFTRLMERQQLETENRVLREQLKTDRGFGKLIGSSSQMQRVYQVILRVAAKRHPVLILGESGTGKELVARSIHAHSPAPDHPFVAVDCGSLTPTLIESELFGHVRGAFTGANQSRMGLLAAAGGGTVFLDEIGELPVELQAKLLRALQEREIRPIGGNETYPLHARVIAATNRNLEEEIGEGRFREDLYFRLNVVSMLLPPLRLRKSDIPSLIQVFMGRHAAADEGITGFAPEAMERLMAYNWPGNIRELENCVQHAIALGTGPLLGVGDLPAAILRHIAEPTDGDAANTMQELERRAIMRALESSGGDRMRAAKLLGIGKTTIYRKLKEYGLGDESLPESG
ncbi:MAG TPA: sigma-54 dependent transcriptional regulator [Terriglobia bacterium]|nr:sigma-54 dependent transcriptional regulator [Terriglobia bacterium]